MSQHLVNMLNNKPNNMYVWSASKEDEKTRVHLSHQIPSPFHIYHMEISTSYKRNFQERCDDASNEQWHLLLYFIKYVNYKCYPSSLSSLSFHYFIVVFCLFILVATFSFVCLLAHSLKNGWKKQTNKRTKWHVYQVSQT